MTANDDTPTEGQESTGEQLLIVECEECAARFEPEEPVEKGDDVACVQCGEIVEAQCFVSFPVTVDVPKRVIEHAEKRMERRREQGLDPGLLADHANDAMVFQLSL
jgi:hypothetical protein